MPNPHFDISIVKRKEKQLRLPVQPIKATTDYIQNIRKERAEHRSARKRTGDMEW